MHSGCEYLHVISLDHWTWLIMHASLSFWLLNCIFMNNGTPYETAQFPLKAKAGDHTCVPSMSWVSFSLTLIAFLVLSLILNGPVSTRFTHLLVSRFSMSVLIQDILKYLPLNCLPCEAMWLAASKENKKQERATFVWCHKWQSALHFCKIYNNKKLIHLQKCATNKYLQARLHWKRSIYELKLWK